MVYPKLVEKHAPVRHSNKITAIRLANLAEQKDPDVSKMINYDVLQIHYPGLQNDTASKKRYFANLYIGGRMKIIHIIEEDLKVIVHFKITLQGSSVCYFNVYRFSQLGLLTELWVNKQLLA